MKDIGHNLKSLKKGKKKTLPFMAIKECYYRSRWIKAIEIGPLIVSSLLIFLMYLSF